MQPRPRGPGTSYLKFNACERIVLNPDLSEDAGEEIFTVVGGVSFYVDNRDREYWVYVPNGYRFNGADIPEFFKNWIKPDSSFGKAAMIHHYLCSVGKVRVAGARMCVPRSEANRVFVQAMRVAKVGWFKRWVLYLAAKHSSSKCSQNLPGFTFN